MVVDGLSKIGPFLQQGGLLLLHGLGLRRQHGIDYRTAHLQPHRIFPFSQGRSNIRRIGQLPNIPAENLIDIDGGCTVQVLKCKLYPADTLVRRPVKGGAVGSQAGIPLQPRHGIPKLRRRGFSVAFAVHRQQPPRNLPAGTGGVRLLNPNLARLQFR